MNTNINNTLKEWEWKTDTQDKFDSFISSFKAKLLSSTPFIVPLKRPSSSSEWSKQDIFDPEKVSKNIDTFIDSFKKSREL